jgi:FkbM family methyltransferase
MLLSHRFKTWLEKKQWYLKLRYNKTVLAVWMMLRPSVKKELAEQKKLYLPLLNSFSGSSNLVFDIGANEGFLAAIFRDTCFKVVAVEPAKRNIAILKQRFRNDSNVIIIEAAVSDKEGEINFYESKTNAAFGTASQKWKEQGVSLHPHLSYEQASAVKTITLDQLIKNYGQPSFIKVDVEGHEEFAIKGLSQKLPLISFEAILPEFLEETRNCIDHLTKLNEKARFNFAANNQLIWDDFKTPDVLLKVIKQLPPQTIEIFCRM